MMDKIELLNRAKELVLNNAVKGFSSHDLKLAAKTNEKLFLTFLQDISDQSQNQVAIETFGEELIKISKLLFPKDKTNIKLSEEKIKGGKADKLSLKDIGVKFNVSIKKLNKELIDGVKVEMEHTNDKTLAKDIAMDHLSEIPDYYTRLKKLEKKGVTDWGKKEIKESLRKHLFESTGSKIIAYHGSRSKFNHFDLSKINSGQASQDFGWGLYFTTKKETGAFYSNMLSNTKSPIEKYNDLNISKDTQLEDYLLKNNIIGAKRRINTIIQNNDEKTMELSELLKSLDRTERYSFLYTVEITPKRLLKYLDKVPDNILDVINQQLKLNIKNIHFFELYSVLKNKLGGKDKSSSFLFNIGVDGIIYPINSRGLDPSLSSNDEYNIVIFDPSIIKIIDITKLTFIGHLKLK